MSGEKTPPQKSNRHQVDPDHSSSGRKDVEAFLDNVRNLAPLSKEQGRGRLIFAMDATLSRQPTWDMALATQAEMFAAVKDIGGLDVQLVYFRGFGECGASKWAGDASSLSRLMTKVTCRGGRTQIRKVLLHARRETEKKKVGALVYVGDCMEEDADELCAIAGELGLLGVPLFLFQEGYEPGAEQTFRELARLSGGAYCRFNPGAADELKALLSAVAVFTTGGLDALTDRRSKDSGAVRALLEQLK